MFRITPDGSELKTGFNFYPLSERKSEIGFVWKWGDFLWTVTYLRKSKKLFSTTCIMNDLTKINFGRPIEPYPILKDEKRIAK